MDKRSSDKYDLIVVGGGAAGFYGAIQTAEKYNGARIIILEKSNKVLSKVKVSGGGRCNVTHDCLEPFALSRHYPRGEKFLKNVFKAHHAEHTIQWFKSKGVQLKVEEDGRMFPITDDSQTIVDCLMREALANRVKIEMGAGVVGVVKEADGFVVKTKEREYQSECVLITSGGNPSANAFDWIAKTGHTIVSPIPSLFTFNDSEDKFKDLMGLAVSNAEVRIAGTKLLQQGPLLITHWGLSGPAVIKLSAWAAEELNRMNYDFTALVSWIGPTKEAEVQQELMSFKTSKAKQKIVTNPQFGLPQRLWLRLCELAEIEEEKIWAEVPQKKLNRLMEFLIRCPFRIKGKTTFKEEFVTCGGVDLKEVDYTSMESKIIQNMFFAGEVLNIDGETGGFNFQAAWSTGYVAATAIGNRLTKSVR